MSKIEELEQKLNEWFKTVSKEEMIKILKKEGFEVIDKESKKEGKWKPKDGEEYWFRDDEGDIVKSSMHREYDWNVWRENNFPIFKTKEQCERYWHFMDTVKEKSYEFNREEWEDVSIMKFYIYYSYGKRTFAIDHVAGTKAFGRIHFKSLEDAQYIIDNFKEELFKYWL